jgi:hypothetical protein
MFKRNIPLAAAADRPRYVECSHKGVEIAASPSID